MNGKCCLYLNYLASTFFIFNFIAFTEVTFGLCVLISFDNEFTGIFSLILLIINFYHGYPLSPFMWIFPQICMYLTLNAKYRHFDISMFSALLLDSVNVC